jgi:hypothetical protein
MTVAELAAYEASVEAVFGATEEHIKQLLKAEKQNRLVILPCEEGATVFTTRWWDNVEEKCTDSKGKPFYRTGMKHKVTKESFHPLGLDYTEWGKTVFPTRKEAEAALPNQ